MSGKHDPPNKAQLLAQFRRTPSVPELMVAAAEAQFPPKMKDDESASCATPPKTDAMGSQLPNRGRKPVVTTEKVQMICALLGHGETEKGACIRAGVGSTAWSAAKRANPMLREKIACARDDWARLRHGQHAAALYESQVARSAGRKVLKPRPTRQAKWVASYLAVRVPLHFAAIPETEIVSACEQCGLHLETWQRQDRAFGLMRKVYEKRAAIRGQHGFGGAGFG